MTGPLALLLLGLTLGQTAEAAEPAPVAQLEVRVTWYLDRGTTYHGRRTAPGIAACSWNLPAGTRLQFRDGRVIECWDRGALGHAGWTDIWVASAAEGREIARTYGDRAVVDVLHWGTP